MIHFKYKKDWNIELLKNSSSVNSISNEIKNVYSNDRRKQTEIIKKLIEKTIQNYAKEECLFGLFSALEQAKHRISPFTATHSYSVTIISCSLSLSVRMNISPIYHLGPEYLEQHQQRFGAEVDAEAVIQLFDAAMDDSENLQRPFSLGIDAGIVFKKSPISHNKIMNLQFEFLKDGVMSSLSCENQATSMKIVCDKAMILDPLLGLRSMPQKQQRLGG